jgi:glutaredoxin 3
MSKDTQTNQGSQVIVYTTPTCHFCNAVKDFLTEKKVSYKEINVQADAQAADDMIRKSGQMGVPVIDIDDQIVIGFNKPKLEELLASV